jgi:hypothetical protein
MQTNNDGSNSPCQQPAGGRMSSSSEEGSPGCAGFQAALLAMSRVRLGAGVGVAVVRLANPPDDGGVAEGHLVVVQAPAEDAHHHHHLVAPGEGHLMEVRPAGDAHHHCAPQDPGGGAEGGGAEGGAGEGSEDPLRPVYENYVPADPAARRGSDGSGSETECEGVDPTFNDESPISERGTGYVPDDTMASPAEGGMDEGGMDDTTGSSPILGRALDLNPSTNSSFESFLNGFRGEGGAAAEPARQDPPPADPDQSSTDSAGEYNKRCEERLKAQESGRSKKPDQAEGSYTDDSFIQGMNTSQLSLEELAEAGPALVQSNFSPNAPPYEAVGQAARADPPSGSPSDSSSSSESSDSSEEGESGEGPSADSSGSSDPTYVPDESGEADESGESGEAGEAGEAAEAAPVKRGRGRPKGSRNKPKDGAYAAVAKRGPGRPRGSGAPKPGIAKRGRGRPRKSGAPKPGIARRGPGRPKGSRNKPKQAQQPAQQPQIDSSGDSSGDDGQVPQIDEGQVLRGDGGAGSDAEREAWQLPPFDARLLAGAGRILRGDGSAGAGGDGESDAGQLQHSGSGLLNSADMDFSRDAGSAASPPPKCPKCQGEMVLGYRLNHVCPLCIDAGSAWSSEPKCPKCGKEMELWGKMHHVCPDYFPSSRGPM